MGNDTNLFSAHDLKRYNPSKDQSIFSLIRRLPMYILESIGLTTIELDHIMAMIDIAPYHSSPLRPNHPTAVHDP